MGKTEFSVEKWEIFTLFTLTSVPGWTKGIILTWEFPASLSALEAINIQIQTETVIYR